MDDIVLDSLELHNYRGFRHLVVEQLGRVNLIVGKNNVGKTSLLEAIELYVSQEGSNSSVPVDQVTVRRDEEFPDWRSVQCRGVPAQSPVEIGPHKGIPFDADGDIYVRPAKKMLRLWSAHPAWNGSPLVTIHAGGLSTDRLIAFWDKIAVSIYEEQVINALRIIEPRVERVAIAVVENGQRRGKRSPKVRLQGDTFPVALRSLGEGMVRLFGLALALVNVPGGVLLVDEIENGFHYSVQPDVWKLIFYLASELNIQVFATTHSQDCVRAFQEAATAHPQVGVLVRLGHRKGDVVASIYDEEDLTAAVEEAVEVR